VVRQVFGEIEGDLLPPKRAAFAFSPITDPDRIAYSDIRRSGRLGGRLIHEYRHAA
jgi:hypothetical protein